MAKNTGITGIGAPVLQIDSEDKFPVTYANQVQGGAHAVATVAARNAIAEHLREWGITCYVWDEDKRYELAKLNNDKTDNGNWRLAGSSVALVWVVENFTAVSGQSIFTVSEPPPVDDTIIDVYRNGLLIPFSKAGNDFEIYECDDLDKIKIKWVKTA